ncbi:hypothetical protein COBT_003310 [Conglomerata obtusa]
MPEKGTQPRKHRGTETLNVIKQQNIAIREYKDLKVRKFRQEYCDVETIGGHPISVLCWVSDEKAQVKRPKPKEPEMFGCETCGREFNERRKMLIHARSHKTVKKSDGGKNCTAKKEENNIKINDVDSGTINTQDISKKDKNIDIVKNNSNNIENSAMGINKTGAIENENTTNIITENQHQEMISINETHDINANQMNDKNFESKDTNKINPKNDINTKSSIIKDSNVSIEKHQKKSIININTVDHKEIHSNNGLLIENNTIECNTNDHNTLETNASNDVKNSENNNKIFTHKNELGKTNNYQNNEIKKENNILQNNNINNINETKISNEKINKQNVVNNDNLKKRFIIIPELFDDTKKNNLKKK